MKMDTTSFYIKPETSPEFLEFYERLDKKNAAPLWESLGELVPVKPRPKCVPALWRYNEIRPLLMEAGRLITAKEAERRVLILENPGIRGTSQITESLYAGLQLNLPGEIAPTHRHTASALRLVIEGNGAYTAVEGERTTMHPGDFILTPSWTYHDHGNPSDTLTVWMDGLDIPLVNMLNTSFAEHYPEEVQSVGRNEGDSLKRYGGNMMPGEFSPRTNISPGFTSPNPNKRKGSTGSYRNGPIIPASASKVTSTKPANRSTQ